LDTAMNAVRLGLLGVITILVSQTALTAAITFSVVLIGGELGLYYFVSQLDRREVTARLMPGSDIG
jgi:hypothetical protein